MQQDDFELFRSRMVAMARLFGSEIDGALLDLYWLCLRDWSREEFDAAVKHLMGNCRFMPRPADFADLRNAVNRVTAGEAFDLARQALRDSMPSEWASLRSGNYLVDRAISGCGGYQALAMVETDKIGFFERRFAEHYESMQESDAARRDVPLLSGACKAIASHAKVAGPQSMSAMLSAMGASDEF
jgi:hypothetical protein